MLNRHHPAFPARAILVTLLLFLVAALGAGCGAAMQIRYQLDPPESGEVLVFDDFSEKIGWEVWSDADSVVNYNSGGLRFFVNQPNYVYWSQMSQDYTDVRLNVSARKIGGPDDNSFGVLCRYRNRDNFYYFVIGSDGYFGIARVLDGRHELISSAQMQYSDVILRGDRQVNQIEAECSGPNLVLTVNDVRLALAYDTELAWGGVGLIVGTYDEVGVDILFDDFTVTQP